MSDDTPSTPSPRRPKWWYSADEKRGFAWVSVVGYDYRSADQSGLGKATLYVYLTGALLSLHGGEADTVYQELKKR